MKSPKGHSDESSNSIGERVIDDLARQDRHNAQWLSVCGAPSCTRSEAVAFWPGGADVCPWPADSNTRVVCQLTRGGFQMVQLVQHKVNQRLSSMRGQSRPKRQS